MPPRPLTPRQRAAFAALESTYASAFWSAATAHMNRFTFDGLAVMPRKPRKRARRRKADRAGF